MTNFKLCEHKEWIGRPAGCVPQFWECTGCLAQMSSGEMILYSAILKLKPEATDAPEST
jgi:hypothetical protein